jgi:hypothetical protein
MISHWSIWDTLITVGLLVVVVGCIVLLVVALDGGWERDHGRNLWWNR